jgi:hypothetical protein
MWTNTVAKLKVLAAYLCQILKNMKSHYNHLALLVAVVIVALLILVILK